MNDEDYDPQMNGYMVHDEEPDERVKDKSLPDPMTLGRALHGIMQALVEGGFAVPITVPDGYESSVDRSAYPRQEYDIDIEAEVVVTKPKWIESEGE
ncbi:MAG: hypothetical protein HN929_05975 [Chloroflexi bacterium]|nr:hypothetical protein [Chloroflexota bacterium]